MASDKTVLLWMFPQMQRMVSRAIELPSGGEALRMLDSGMQLNAGFYRPMFIGLTRLQAIDGTD